MACYLPVATKSPSMKQKLQGERLFYMRMPDRAAKAVGVPCCAVPTGCRTAARGLNGGRQALVWDGLVGAALECADKQGSSSSPLQLVNCHPSCQLLAVLPIAGRGALSVGNPINQGSPAGQMTS